MSEFKNAQVTLKGNMLLAKALMGEALTFTKIVLGDGYSNKPIMEMQDLVSIKKELPITKLRRKEQVAIIGSILKMGEIEPFYWRELGLYARGEDGVEVLYMYGNAADLASYISSNGLNEKLIDINVVIGNASNVSAVIDSSLVFLTQQDLVDHNNDEEAHQALKIWVLSLFNNGDWAKYSQAEDIQNRIGQNTDVEPTPTLFGKMNGLNNLVSFFKGGFDAFRGAYTDARAFNLDRLDAHVSSRAPADTALHNGIWTHLRAEKLDNIGNTYDGGGSSTTGTVMAKLNAILNWFNGIWTADRAAKLDWIAAKVGQGDYFGKELRVENLYKTGEHHFSHAKGGIAILSMYETEAPTWKLEIDGVLVFNYLSSRDLFVTHVGESAHSFQPLIIPFNSYFKLTITPANGRTPKILIKYYLNR